MKPLATIHFGFGDIIYTLEKRWQAARPGIVLLDKLAILANNISFFASFKYTPSKGSMGAYLAHTVAKKMGGKVELPEEPKEQDTEQPTQVMY